MTSRERVLAALEHRKPDRPPLNFFGTAEVWEKMKRHLQLETDEEVRRYIGSDMRYVGPRYVGPSQFTGFSGFHAGGTDVWGARWDTIQAGPARYNEVVYHPLARATTLQQIKDHPWPSPAWFDVSELAQEIRELNRDEEYAVVFSAGSFVEAAWTLRGLEQFFIDLLLAPEIPSFILGKVADLVSDVTMRAVEAADGDIDIIWSAGDIAGQDGMLFSPDIWRQHFKPRHRQLIEPYKQMGLKTRYHTDGSLIDIIEDFIEMGLDLLDPIQPHTPGMAPENLARLFGGRLAFYGGVDTQHLLPFGTPDQVEKEALRYIETLGSNGGYVLAASNAIQPDVPVENILALFRTGREYRY